MMTFLNKIYLFDYLGDKDGKANIETNEGKGKDYYLSGKYLATLATSMYM